MIFISRMRNSNYAIFILCILYLYESNILKYVLKFYEIKFVSERKSLAI